MKKWAKAAAFEASLVNKLVMGFITVAVHK